MQDNIYTYYTDCISIQYQCHLTYLYYWYEECVSSLLTAVEPGVCGRRFDSVPSFDGAVVLSRQPLHDSPVEGAALESYGHGAEHWWWGVDHWRELGGRRTTNELRAIL